MILANSKFVTTLPVLTHAKFLLLCNNGENDNVLYSSEFVFRGYEALKTQNFLPHSGSGKKANNPFK